MTIKPNAVIRTLGDLEEFVARVSESLKGNVNKNPEFAVPIEMWLREIKGELATHHLLYWDKADADVLLEMEEADRQQREDNGRDQSCSSCRMEPVNSASLEPPELIIDPWCPEHGGRDPDAEYDRYRDDERE